MKLKFKLIILIALGCLFCNCAVRNNYKFAEQDLVGLWEEKYDGGHLIVLINIDGTYIQKSAKSNYNSPPDIATSSGKWSISGDKYVITLSYIDLSKWSGEVGKTYKMDIKSITNDTFKYYSTDDADSEQRKIGSASLDLFRDTDLESPHS